MVTVSAIATTGQGIRPMQSSRQRKGAYSRDAIILDPLNDNDAKFNDKKSRKRWWQSLTLQITIAVFLIALFGLWMLGILNMDVVNGIGIPKWKKDGVRDDTDSYDEWVKRRRALQSDIPVEATPSPDIVEQRDQSSPAIAVVVEKPLVEEQEPLIEAVIDASQNDTVERSPDDLANISSAISNSTRHRKPSHAKTVKTGYNKFHVDETDVTYAVRWKVLPSSSVWCRGSSRVDRICRFRNVCYHPKQESWFIVKTDRTIEQNVPAQRYVEGLIELTTIVNHSVFFWTYDEASAASPNLRNVRVRYETDPHFMFARLHPKNIMHQLHDDVLGMYFLLKEYVGGGSAQRDMPFSLDSHRIMLLDNYGFTDTSRVLQYLANKPLRFKGYLDHEPDVITCFRDATIGISKVANWYQYGFTEPQGKISNKNVSGLHVREVAEWYIKRIGLALQWNEPGPEAVPEMMYSNQSHSKSNAVTAGSQPPNLEVGGVPADAPIPNPNAPNSSDVEQDAGHSSNTTVNLSANSTNDTDSQPDVIIIVSRTLNRLILNEKELATSLSHEFKLETHFLRMEEMTFEEQIKLLRRARIVLGMHGSALIMAMFCRRGTVVIEMFPYAVPPDGYTPYQSMCGLPGMDLVYRAWENKHEDASVAYPKRPPLYGGIAHLSPDEQEKISSNTRVPTHICCSDPYFLYRIYQDTVANTTEIILQAHDALRTSKSQPEYHPIRPEFSELLPPAVKTFRCLNHTNRPVGELWAEWDLPWNGAVVEKWNIHVQNNKGEYVSQGASVAIPGFSSGEEVKFWVRPIRGEFMGEYSRKGTCVV
ncbi:hypothetical protein SmJEL517_g03031 [Synchytrium microbalum]|uniref:Glycosyltransferase 61 catalytic domain-containing protein n=1 Tax=Synchytrium microbalum TaxID=1806994 RepID=A0A507C8J9_9FUNG|nr:uncharacterized protein SmJEL517_g03031 [Synchytrium microbalum]TPX34304.1 hypothetical protein SmJEL517_g03031 [Synchytrium microbalum]